MKYELSWKWKYDKKFKQYYMPDEDLSYVIEKSKSSKRWILRVTPFENVGIFDKLKHAKLVAELLEEG